MAAGVPSTNEIQYTSLEALVQTQKLLVPGFVPGVFFATYGSGTALASSTSATSIFTGYTSSNSFGTRVLSPNFFVRGDTKSFATENLIAGGRIKGHLSGVMGTTATPNLTITVGLTNAGTYTAFSTSGAVATVACTSPCDWTLDFDMTVRVLGAASTASIVVGGVFQYFSGSNATLQSIPLAHTITTATLDTTVPLTLDGQFTWGTSSASNTITVYDGYLEYLV